MPRDDKPVQAQRCLKHSLANHRRGNRVTRRTMHALHVESKDADLNDAHMSDRGIRDQLPVILRAT